MADLDGQPVGQADGGLPGQQPAPGMGRDRPGRLAGRRPPAPCGPPCAGGCADDPAPSVSPGRCTASSPPTRRAARVRPAMLWSDARALGPARVVPGASRPAVRARLANPLSPGMAGPLLAWLAGNEPEAYRATRWALPAQGLAAGPLTGRVRHRTQRRLGHAAVRHRRRPVGRSRSLTPSAWTPASCAPSAPAPAITPGAHRRRSGDSSGCPRASRSRPAPPTPRQPRSAPAWSSPGDRAADHRHRRAGRHARSRRFPTILPPDPVTHLYRAATDPGWYAHGARCSTAD